MAALFWDASGLAKYYTEEIGSETAKAVFSQAIPLQMLTTPWGYTETFALDLLHKSPGLEDRDFRSAECLLRRRKIFNLFSHAVTFCFSKALVFQTRAGSEELRKRSIVAA
ncbi:MAG: hypothetical protein ACRYFS_09515 [Janthinobacterium lividum]